MTHDAQPQHPGGTHPIIDSCAAPHTTSRAGSRCPASYACPSRAGNSVAAGSAPLVIPPKVRDPHFVTIRRGGTLTDSDQSLLATLGGDVRGARPAFLPVRVARRPATSSRDRPGRAWMRGDTTMTASRTSAGHANAVMKSLSWDRQRPAARASARATRANPRWSERRTPAARRRSRARSAGSRSTPVLRPGCTG